MANEYFLSLKTIIQLNNLFNNYHREICFQTNNQFLHKYAEGL